MEPIAHLRLVEKSEPPEYDEQTLKAHNENSGKYAAEALRCIELDKVGSFCGKIHDLGKATKKFFDYIQPGNTLRRGEEKLQRILLLRRRTEIAVQRSRRTAYQNY